MISHAQFIAIIAADPAYFTEGYAVERDAAINSSKLGNRKYLNVPLGPTIVKGHINYSRALPKPEYKLEDDGKLIFFSQPTVG